MSPRLFRCEIPVRSYEVDFAGVVNNAVFVNYLEHARMQIFAELGVSFGDWMNGGTAVVVRHLELEYHAPARLDDRLRVESWVEEVGRTSVRLGQRVLNQDETNLLDAKIIGVFVDRSLRPTPVPPELRDHFPPEALGTRG